MHQPALTALFDLHQARGADSFDKCYREIVRLITALTQPPQPLTQSPQPAGGPTPPEAPA